MRKVVMGLACVLAPVVFGASSVLLSQESRREPVVQTSGGALEGRWADVETGVSVFRGVPFAQPPLTRHNGDRRHRR